MDIENGIIQHHFIQDRNISNQMCYICGESKEKHLKEKELKENINNNINMNQNNINISNKNEEE